MYKVLFAILTKLSICKAGTFPDRLEVGRKYGRCCQEEGSPQFFEGKLRKVADRNTTIIHTLQSINGS